MEFLALSEVLSLRWDLDEQSLGQKSKKKKMANIWGNEMNSADIKRFHWKSNTNHLSLTSQA